jgi:small subunit ribosomal protein S13
MRLIGVTIPDEKKAKIALTYIYGIGSFAAEQILEKVGIDPDKRTKDLTQEEIGALKKEIEASHKVEGELRQVLKQNINRLKDIKSYRGTRHARRLPLRGQRTKRNSRTVRGNVRHTAGSGRRKLELK